MKNSKYLTIKESSEHTDEYGNSYPDIFLFPMLKFELSDTPAIYILNERDIYRFDLLIYNYYGSSYYDDFVLFYNNIEHIADVAPGTKISLPSKQDINSFYRKNFA